MIHLTKEEREKILQEQKKSYLQSIVNKNLEEKYMQFQEASKEQALRQQQEAEANAAPANKLTVSIGNDSTKCYVLSLPNIETLRYSQSTGEIPVSKSAYE